MTDHVAEDRTFSEWCVLTHARPVIVEALRLWRLNDAASWVESAPSLPALKLMALDADEMVRRHIRFVPLRRDLSNALNTLHAAATFALRGDAVNTAAIVIGVFTNAASARSWRRPWTRFMWRKRRAEVITRARREQAQYRVGSSQ
jgi:hypothetical protein